MENKSKVITFIGFSIRARKLKTGVNAITLTKKGIRLLMICHTASKNTFDDAIKLKERFKCELIISNKYLIEDLVLKQNCKLIGFLDFNLTKAVLENLDEDFSIYSGGNII